eukprot:SM000050S17067  [mRNA]  locus=s50:654482:658558:- [translate_table: standard]
MATLAAAAASAAVARPGAIPSRAARIPQTHVGRRLIDCGVLASQGSLPRTVCSATLASEKAAKAEGISLGKSGVVVPQIGVGAWSWGDKFFWNEGDWDDRKVKEAKAAFEVAVDSGLGFFDTAEVYGTAQFGGDDSEKILGRFIKERQAKVGPGEQPPVVATKFAALPWRFGRKPVANVLRTSLEKLGLESVDLYQLHWPLPWGNDGFVDGLADVVEQGLAKAVGVSNYSEDRMRQAHAQLAKRGIPLASNQVHYNLFYRLPEENGVKRACDELDVTLIAYSPLAQGILSGKYTPDNPPKGPRANSYSVEWLNQANPTLTMLKELGQKYGKTPIQVSLNWLVAQGNVVPIPGAKSKAQAEEFAGALNWSLTKEESDELRRLAGMVPRIQGFPVEAW